MGLRRMIKGWRSQLSHRASQSRHSEQLIVSLEMSLTALAALHWNLIEPISTPAVFQTDLETTALDQNLIETGKIMWRSQSLEVPALYSISRDLSLLPHPSPDDVIRNRAAKVLQDWLKTSS